MKRIKEKFNKNIVLGISLLVLGLVTGIGILSTGYNILASVNPFNLAAGNVTYSNSSTSKKNVQDSIDELYNKVSTRIDPSTIKTNTTGTIFASSSGILIRRGEETHFFKINNYSQEKTSAQNVFSSSNCKMYSGYGGYMDCFDSSARIGCDIYNSGQVGCFDYTSNTSCDALSNGSVSCHTM